MIVGINQGAAEAKSGNMSAASCGATATKQQQQQKCAHFQMPLHYPRYARADYETMPEWKLDCLLAEYGLPVMGNVEQKRKFAMGSFLWVL